MINDSTTEFSSTPAASGFTWENVFEVLDGWSQLTVLNHSIFHILQILYGVDALPPVFTDVCQRVLDVFHITQSAVELREACSYPIQLRLNSSLKRDKRSGKTIPQINRRLNGSSITFNLASTDAFLRASLRLYCSTLSSWSERCSIPATLCTAVATASLFVSSIVTESKRQSSRYWNRKNSKG